MRWWLIDYLKACIVQCSCWDKWYMVLWKNTMVHASFVHKGSNFMINFINIDPLTHSLNSIYLSESCGVGVMSHAGAYFYTMLAPRQRSSIKSRKEVRFSSILYSSHPWRIPIGHASSALPSNLIQQSPFMRDKCSALRLFRPFTTEVRSNPRNT